MDFKVLLLAAAYLLPGVLLVAWELVRLVGRGNGPHDRRRSR